MKKLLISLVMVSFLISAPKKIEEKQIGRYQLSTTTYENPKTSKVYIVETIIDTKTGEIVKRHRFYYKNYKKEWKKK
tara:strand:+ start:218 stop:448 length:231 start_codon:yes stop_codon:yes gene_type:complete